MSGALPTSPGLKEIKHFNDSGSMLSVSESGKQQARDTGYTQKQFMLIWPIMTRAEFEPIYTHMRKQRGSYGTWTFIDPAKATPQGTITGTAQVVGAHSAGDTTINIDGWTGTLVAGDILKFANHSLVYTVVENATGPTTITIEPPLEEALVDNEGVTYTSVPYTVRLIDKVIEDDTISPNLYNFSCKVIEAK